jgi:hypothetical protein
MDGVELDCAYVDRASICGRPGALYVFARERGAPPLVRPDGEFVRQVGGRVTGSFVVVAHAAMIAVFEL